MSLTPNKILLFCFFPHTKKEDTVVTFGMEGNKVINSYGELKLYYKNKEFVDDFTIMNLDNAFDQIKQESGVQIHGILGNRFFEKYKSSISHR